MKSGSRDSWTIGIDDTDMPGIGGTGQLARRLAAHVESIGLGRPTGVTRHQLFEGPGVPKTARNSAAAIGFGEVGSAAQLLDVACEIVSRESIPGSDPGVALGRGPVGRTVTHFAQRAQQTLVTQTEALRLVVGTGIDVVGLGGTEDGVIGALAAMALRSDGNDGRYVGLSGIRDVTGVMTVAQVIGRTDIAKVVDVGSGRSLGHDSVVDLGDWVRPRVVAGRPIIAARRNGKGWVNADTRPT